MTSKRTLDTGGDLTSAVESLNQTVQFLATSAAQLRQTVQETSTTDSTMAAETPPPPAARSPDQEAEARRFYERLVQTGQLIDVDEKTDLSRLPASVTHIRHPDGSVERISFSASTYGGG